MELFSALQPWHWFVLGTALLVFEIFGAGGFLIGIAVAALLMAVLSWLMAEISWEWQLILFGAGAVVFTLLYLKLLKQFNQATDAPYLNDRAAQLVGTRFQLEQAINGQGSVQIGDTRWKVKCEASLEDGSEVIVTDSDGMTLLIAAV
jgi:membrane protein implicated in regulation of membrane protease activity